MSKTISFILILGLILASYATETTVCAQNNERDLLETGLIEFQNINQRQSCKQIQIKFKIPNNKLQLAASVINTENYHVTNGIDYAIKIAPKPTQNKFVASLLSDFNANWTKIRVSYFASSRDDLIMGSFLTDSFQTLKCIQNQKSQKNILQVSNVVPNWNKDFLSAKPIVFISGIKTISTVINSLKISTVELNSSGILNVQLQSIHGLQLQFVQLSYILVSQAFPYQHGYELNHPEYSFPVFEQFTNNSLVQVKWGVFTGSLICEGSQCNKVCLIKDECVKAGGNQLNGHCHICEKGNAWDGTQCISLCGQNQLWNGEACLCKPQAIRFKSACVLCVANSTPDKAQKQCICNNGFIWNNWKSTCISFTCPVNSQPLSTQTGYDCVCKVGYYKSQNTCKLIPDCPLNSVFNLVDKKCVCNIEGQFMSNGSCSSCGKNQQFDNLAKKCICKPTFLLVSGSCVACPAYSSLNQQKTKCICNEGYIWNDWKVACVAYKCPTNSIPVCIQSGVKCNCKDGYFANVDNCDLIPKCPAGSFFDLIQRICQCEKKGFYLMNGQCSECPLNSGWVSNQCVCNAGYANLNGVCTFVCGKNQVFENNVCNCNSKSVSINKVCQQCPVNSVPNKEKSLCICNQGLRWDEVSKSCAKITCPQNSVLQTVNNTSQCVCNDGYILQNLICVKVGRCPTNSVWNQDKLSCICSSTDEYLINNECKKCGLNQQWNQKQRKFTCRTGFNLIANQCKACEVGQFFNGFSCQCNLGSYRNALKCETCHSTCGTCSGSNSTQCLTCSDVTFTFKNGTCSKQKACPRGLYQKGASCSPCSTYCADCISQSTCNSCITGFQLDSVTYGGVTASYCTQKCGDGKRFQLDCDDGNNKNGDGCSNDCKVESGWTCTGGSSTSSSVCMVGTPDRTYLEMTGTVHLYGRIVQGVRLSYIPEALSANDCAECYNLLWVRVIRSDIVPAIRVNYLPKSRYQFLVEFEFHGTFSIPSFNIAVQINPEYAKYFNRRDMAQIQMRTIDPSVLAIKDKEEQLTLDAIKPTKTIPLSKTLVTQIFN